MKKCSVCKEIKDLSEFGEDKKNSTGHRSSCRNCVKLKARIARANGGRMPSEQINFDVNGVLHRKCKVCKELKLPSEFNVHKQCFEGLRRECKQCSNRSEATKKSKRNYRVKPHVIIKDKARSELRSAVSSLKIIKPIDCSICGKEDLRLHGHHEDYSKPLNVVWCCVSCHLDIHSKEL